MVEFTHQNKMFGIRKKSIVKERKDKGPNGDVDLHNRPETTSYKPVVIGTIMKGLKGPKKEDYFYNTKKLYFVCIF